MEASQALDEGSIPFARFLTGHPMQTNPQELETKTSSNKDMWLFLIILDVIFLCVFGFFLYKYFSARVVNPAPVAAVLETETVDALPEIADGEVVSVTETAVVETPTPVQPAAPKEEVKPAVQPEKQAVPVIPTVSTPAQTTTAAKESVVVSTVPNSKYRRVTFKWFGEGNKVSIVSGFTMSKPQALKKVGDHWETTLSIAPGTYKFLYIVDGKNTRDPYSDEKDGRSVVVIK